MKPTIILAADHAGFALKEIIKKLLESKSYSILDVGAHELVPEDDFPVYMIAAAMKVAEDIEGNTKAIIFGGSGQGEAMVANRFPGVRAVVWYGDRVSKIDPKLGIVRLSREHNDANILSIGARFVDEEEAKKAVETWLETSFSSEEKYKRRNEEIDNIE
ncbi:MAG: RpiB/LacA/LacB family sugar-phosphate isomerase [Candidatus Paceibacterota bacterium]|jgi:ribose 5-phosphate isomerase B